MVSGTFHAPSHEGEAMMYFLTVLAPARDMIPVARRHERVDMQPSSRIVLYGSVLRCRQGRKKSFHSSTLFIADLTESRQVLFPYLYSLALFLEMPGRSVQIGSRPLLCSVSDCRACSLILPLEITGVLHRVETPPAARSAVSDLKLQSSNHKKA